MLLYSNVVFIFTSIKPWVPAPGKKPTQILSLRATYIWA